MEDLHFIQRLERVGWREKQLALRLYREPELVRLLLNEADAPDVARIAIALSDNAAGPHVIVARDGAFVTCLGAGMSVAGLPIVPRHRIDRAADKHEVMKGRLAYLDWATENAGSVRRMWRSLFTDAHRVPREVIVGLAPLIQIFAPRLTDMWIEEDQSARALVYENTNRFSRQRERLSSKDVEVLDLIWRRHWATAHLVALMGLMDQEHLTGLSEVLLESDEPTVYGMHAMRFGFWPTTLRGAWTSARIGQGVLKAAKLLLQSEAPRLPNFVLGATLSIAFVGAAHGRLRAEAQKALACPEPDASAGAIEVHSRHFRRLFARALDPDLLLGLDQGAAAIEESARAVAEEDHLTYRPENVDLMKWVMSNRYFNVYSFSEDVAEAATDLGWFARAELFDFYLPEVFLHAVPKWTPGDTLKLIEQSVGFGTYRAPAPKPNPPKVGRNDPCPCGSGKKYKRCCGA